MAYTALYRKWRPAVFEDVKGQEHIVRTLKNQILSRRVGHAYLFCGTRGTGKTTVAKILARAVNCEAPVDGSPCGQCRTCRNIEAGVSLNVAEIDAASNNGVDNIREIREQVQYPPTEGRYRVYIIDEVHMLSSGAFNALLKTLEEPPSYVIFILATTEVNRIPVTVLSRCQRYDFKRIPVQTLTERLAELSRAEQMDVEDRALAYIARSADGSMRDALSLLDQCAAFHFGERLTYDHVLEILGAVDTGVFSRLFRAVAENRTADCIRLLDGLILQGRELTQFVTDFIWYLRNLLLLRTAENAEDMVDLSSENLKILREDSEMVPAETIMRDIRVFSELSGQIRYAPQKRVLTELALIRLTKPQMEENYDSVLERLNRIEETLEKGLAAGVSARPREEGAARDTVQGEEAAPRDKAQGEEGAPRDTVQGEETAARGEAPRQTGPRQVELPRAQLEDLQMIRKEWARIVRDLGGSIRSSFRDTVVEPGGEGCLCVVFSGRDNFEIGRRPTVLGRLEEYVKNTYGKEIYFKARLLSDGERTDTVYVSDEDLKNHIKMDITFEED